MLIGTYQHTIDPKGRLFIPVKLRADLGESFIITRGTGKNLFGLSYTEWSALSGKFDSLPIADEDAQNFSRLFFASANECDVDKQGRVLVNAALREHAQLEKDVMIIGVSTRIEIWSAENWQSYRSSLESNYTDMLGKMAARGI